MSEFLAFLELGFTHITDLNGYDHILFLMALAAPYQPKDWKHVLVLATFFTIGHSFTLALAALNVVDYDPKLIEVLIPLSIFLTCLLNLNKKRKLANPIQYFLVSFFGLIHGLGFSSYLRSLMGKSSNIILELFSFNLGIELGQIVILLCFLVISLFFQKIVKIKPQVWSTLVSILVGLASLSILINQIQTYYHEA